MLYSLRQQLSLRIGSFVSQPLFRKICMRGRLFDPSGMMARAKYEATTVFVDDDKVEHLKFSYHFEIKKDWK